MEDFHLEKCKEYIKLKSKMNQQNNYSKVFLHLLLFGFCFLSIKKIL